MGGYFPDALKDARQLGVDAVVPEAEHEIALGQESGVADVIARNSVWVTVLAAINLDDDPPRRPLHAG